MSEQTIHSETLYVYALRFKEIKTRFENKEITRKQAQIQIIENVFGLYDAYDFQTETGIDMGFIKSLFGETGFGRKQKVLERNIAIGSIHEGLLIYGCNPNQAAESLMDWFGFKSNNSIYTAIKSYKEEVGNVTGNKKFRKETFANSRWEIYLNFLKHRKKNFPKMKETFPDRYPNALKAYRTLHQEMVEEAQRQNIFY